MKENVILYFQQYEAIKGLSLEDKGRLLDAIFSYAIKSEIPPNLPPLVDMAFSFIRTSMDLDATKYQKKCDRNREIANMRWNANASERIPTDANDADTNTNTNNQYPITENQNGENNSKRFLPPSIDEVKAYCRERKNNVDPSKFIDFYAAKGWLIGRNKMKNWQAAIRTWEKEKNDEEPIQYTRRKATELVQC